MPKKEGGKVYLSFFIKPETKNLKEIKELLEKGRFSVKSEGNCEEYRIVFFNGPDINNFCYTGHKLFRDPPEGVTSPFLIKVGNAWTVQGLRDLLKNYAYFHLPYFNPLDFPQEEDFDKKGSKDKRLQEKIFGMEQTARNCNASEREINMIREIILVLEKESVGDIKKRIFYFLLSERKIILPWGSLPTGEKARGHLVEWINRTNTVFSGNKDINRKYI